MGFSVQASVVVLGGELDFVSFILNRKHLSAQSPEFSNRQLAAASLVLTSIKPTCLFKIQFLLSFSNSLAEFVWADKY